MQTAPIHNQQQASALLHHEITTDLHGLQRLLVAYDSSNAAAKSLRYAIALAKAFDAEVIIAHVETPQVIGGRMDDGLANIKLEQAEERHDLQMITNHLKQEGIKASYLIRSGSPTDLLVQLVGEYKPDLILMGAYGHHAAERITLGSTAEYLLRCLNCPVLVVGPSVADPPPHGVRLSEILYASSLPVNPARTQNFIRDLARRFAMHVHIVHVETYGGLSSDRGHLHDLEMQEENIADHFRCNGIGSSWTLRFGSREHHLLDQANAVSADLVCFGIIHPATDPSQMGLLSALIRSARCPILTVPGAT